MRRGQAGVAMVVVLWVVALLTIMAGSFSLSTQRNTALLRNAQDRARDLALADAGVHYALLMLSQPDPAKRWRSDGARYEAVLPGGRVELAVFDEAGKIDLNAASEQTLRALLGKLLDNDDNAAALADKIMDWRDADELTRTNGAEAKEYAAAGKAHVPQNKNFQALEELQMVLGITPALYKKLEPLLTIYSGQDGFNPQKASSAALQLLLGMDQNAALDYIKQRRATPPNAPQPPNVPPPPGIRLLAAGEMAYTLFARAQAGEGPGAGLKVVARRQFSRNNGAPFAFASWKQQIFGPDGGAEAALAAGQ